MRASPLRLLLAALSAVAGATLLAACGGATVPAAPTISNSADDPSTTGDGVGSLCDAIVAAVDAAPDFTSLALSLDDPDASSEVPSSLTVDGARVTVQISGITDVTIRYRSGGIPMFEALRDEFENCRAFDDEWELETTVNDEVHDLTYTHPGDGDRGDRGVAARIRVMSTEVLMDCIHSN